MQGRRQASRRRQSAAASGLVRSLGAELLESRQLLAAVVVQLSPSRDNTIYNVAAGDQSNGAGEFMVVGGLFGNAQARRGLIGFDITAANIPEGSTIIDVTLQMHLSTSVGGAASISLHRVLKNWGEGHSSAGGSEFEGAPSTPFDATWLFSLYDSTVWTNPGGDFAGASSTVTTEATGSYVWTGPGLVNDVQQWLDSPSTNFGWLLKSPEVSGNIKAFDSRDSNNGSLTPLMEITYEEPLRTGIISGRQWHDRNGDGLREIPAVSQLDLEFRNGRDFYNLTGNNEYWYYAPSGNSWYILTQDGKLTRWDGRAGRITGPLIVQLDPRVWYQPRSILGDNGQAPEPWLNGFTVELVNQSGDVVGIAVTVDRDLNQDGVIQEEAERGWYQFSDLNAGVYTVRAASIPGWAQSANESSPKASRARQLDVTLGLFVSGGLHENFGGRGERWLRGSGNVWYYITPSGDFYRWNGRPISAANPLTGTLVESLGLAYYRDVSLLHSATDPNITLNSEDASIQRNFGAYQPAIITGRTWNDVNPDGRRNHPQLSTITPTAPPAGAPAATTSLPWYTALVPESEIRDGGSTQVMVQTYFYVTTNGAIWQWNSGSPAVLWTTVSGIAGSTPGQVISAGLAVEHWVNGTTIELLDDQGHVLMSTVSFDVDRDSSGSIDVEAERGWYRFDQLVPGRYSVRALAPAGSVSTTSGPAALQSQVAALQQNAGFRAATRDHYNFGLRHERWFQNRNNDWFFITPAGTVFEWDKNSGGTRGTAKGRQVAQFSSTYYLNLSLLFQPLSAGVNLQSGQSAISHSGASRILDGVFASLVDELL